MRRGLVSAGAFAAMWSGGGSAQESSIAERLASEIRTALPGAEVVVPDPDGLDISYAGQTQSVGIGSVHAACAQGVVSCDAAIESYAQRAASYMLETMPFSSDQLRIVVRSNDYLTKLHDQMNISEDFVSEQLVGDLVRICYRDLPQGRRPIVPSDLMAINLDPSTALSACEQNSRNSLAPIASLWKELPKRGIGIMKEPDDVTGYLSDYEAWQPLAEKLGELIVSAPSLDTLLYARAETATDVDALAALSNQIYATASVPISAHVFRWTDHGWVVEPH
jgi:hypothetical protein